MSILVYPTNEQQKVTLKVLVTDVIAILGETDESCSWGFGQLGIGWRLLTSELKLFLNNSITKACPT